MSKSIAQWARHYTEKHSLHLVPIEPNRKFPRSNNWGERAISDPQIAEAFWAANPDWNMGMALGPSRMCSLDIDCLTSFRIICDAFGVDLDQLIKETPTIQGSLEGMRLEFRVPEGVDLPYVKLNWRPESDPEGTKHKALMAEARAAKENGDIGKEEELRAEAKQYAMYTVFELRSATDGSQKQDVLPPSFHFDAGKNYEWLTPPADGFSEPPPWLLTVWSEFKEKFELQFKMACPWANAEQVYEKKAVSRPVQYNGDREGGFATVVNEFNRSSDIHTTLQNYGYKRIGNRYLSPMSSTGLPGVAVFNESNKCWIHHASDELCSDESGRPVAPFDLYCHNEFNGDYKKAVTAIAQSMGISATTPQRNVQRSSGAQPLPDGALIDRPPSSPNQDAPVSINRSQPLPWTNDKHKPLKHIDNLVEICRRLQVTVRYNVIRKEEEIIVPQHGFSRDNEANASFAYITSQCSLFDFPTDKNQEFLTYIADSNPYNPAQAWITSKPWDGVDRMGDFLETVQVAGDPTLKNTLVRRWMLSAVVAAVNPRGVAAQGVLVFQGDQGLGKTQWFKSLIPDEINETTTLLQDGLMLRPDDKDSVKQVCSHWLVELGELDATFRKSDIAQLKSFITRDTDTIRRPYARKESTFARRTVFFGSVNPREFLHDETGNRRYWTVECQSLNWQHGLDMQQVWAQLLDSHSKGEMHTLTSPEIDMLNTNNEEYVTADPIEERILQSYDWAAPDNIWEWKQATDILLEVGIDRPSRADTTKAGQVVRKLNIGQAKRTGGKRLLRVPPRAFN